MARTRGRSPRADERGTVAVIVGVLAVAMFGLAAMVVDLGHARDVRREAQNAADAASLAAGNALYGNTTTPHFAAAVKAAKDYAAENFGTTEADWAACTDSAALRYKPPATVLTPTTTPTACISFEYSGSPVATAQDSSKPDTVRVLIPIRNVETPLGNVVGTSHVAISAQAQSRLRLDAVPTCALCIVGEGTHDLQNGDVTVSGGDIGFNGSVAVSNNGLVATDGRITVESTASGSYANYTPDPVTGQPRMSDPLGFLPMPDITGLTAKTDPCTQGPGLYGSVDLRSKTCNLSPGLYVIGGSGSKWDMSGNDATILKGADVTLYFTCGSPTAPTTCTSLSNGATLDASGNATLNLTAPTSGPLKGLVIVYDRNNTNTLRLTGNGGGGLQGTIYAPAAELQMNGNGCTTTYHALIVVGDIEMNGNPTCLNSAYAHGQNVDLPPDQLHLSQ